MRPARRIKKMDPPYTWDQLQDASWVKESVQARLDEWTPKLFGHHLLKLGGLSCELTSYQSTIKHQVNLDSHNPCHNVLASTQDLPFIEKSFDAVIMTHLLDYSNDPHHQLREVDRVMREDGYLILSGSSPMSLMGLSRLFSWRKLLPWKKKQHSLKKRMFTPSRVKDWLSVLNYQVIHCEVYAAFPWEKYRGLAVYLEGIIGGANQYIGSQYFIVARKRTYPLKPVKKAFPLKRKLSPASVRYQSVKGSQLVKSYQPVKRIDNRCVRKLTR
ncbi:class I SAM-dependent methyltransferase [Vibrio sp.]|nr:class I SAM-dependent methyltransferase [Vibrio sp.]